MIRQEKSLQKKSLPRNPLIQDMVPVPRATRRRRRRLERIDKLPKLKKMKQILPSSIRKKNYF